MCWRVTDSALFRQVEAPFIPKCKGPGDTSNFNTYEEDPNAVREASELLYAREFADF